MERKKIKENMVFFIIYLLLLFIYIYIINFLYLIYI